MIVDAFVSISRIYCQISDAIVQLYAQIIKFDSHFDLLIVIISDIEYFLFWKIVVGCCGLCKNKQQSNLYFFLCACGLFLDDRLRLGVLILSQLRISNQNLFLMVLQKFLKFFCAR